MRTTTRLAIVLLVTAAVFVAPAVQAADTDIVITEIMQNPLVLADLDGEWFEIHNVGLDPVDIEGWTIKDDGIDNHVIANGGPLVVAPGAYMVLGRNAAAMALESVTLGYQYASISLSNADDEIVLLNTSLVEIDRVMYTGASPWPDPDGASMMWDELSATNDLGENWSASTAVFGNGDHGTPGSANGETPLQAPIVSSVIHRRLQPEPGESVTVTAVATDSDGAIDHVLLWSRVNGGSFTSTPMTIVADYTGTIAAGLLGDLVEYYVEAVDNDGLSGFSPSGAPADTWSYTVAPRTLTDIAAIHADSAGFDGQLVTIQAQVYIPGDYKADGSSVSAYVQDASARGLNIFGTAYSTGMTLLNDRSNVVQVTGTVDWYQTTLEIIGYDAVLVSSGSPYLTPVVETTGAAAAPSYEGTYVQAAGTVTAIAATTGTNPAHNVTIDDGSGPLIVRIDDDLVPDIGSWLVGDAVTAAGAGGSYGGAGEIIVGLVSDLLNEGQGPDTTAPTLLGAALEPPLTVLVSFDEAIDAVTGGTTANYSVFETAAPGNVVAVLAAVVQADPATVALTLAADPSGTPHTVAVSGVTDLAGNPIASGASVPLVEPSPVPTIIITEIMQNPNVLADADGEWFEVYNAGTADVDMNGWTISDLGIDSHVIDNGGPLVIGAGEYKVFCLNASAMALEGVTAFYQYAGIALGNADDELILAMGDGTIVDVVAWDGGPNFPDPTGASMAWTGEGDNDLGANWVESTTPFGSGDLGTPGAANQGSSPAPLPALASALRANAPNPFNPMTALSFVLGSDGDVRLGIYDVRGALVRQVVDEHLAAGSYDGVWRWDGRDEAGRAVTSGIYFQRLQVDGRTVGTGKMTLVR